MSLFPSSRARIIAIVILMVFKAFAIIIAFPSSTILLTNSCTSIYVLGTLNGFATMFSGLGRAFGPASTGLVFSWGAENGYMPAAYFFLGLVATIGIIPAFMIVEGDGPSASIDNSDTEGSDVLGDDEDSEGIFPSETAVGDSSDDDEPDTSSPLLGKKPDRRGSKYNTVKN